MKIQGADLVLLLDLVSRESEPWTARQLVEETGLSLGTVQRGLARLGELSVFDASSRRINRSEVEALLLGAVRFMFPGRLGAETRGVPTAWSALPLNAQLADSGPRVVWPAPTGEVRGAALEPLHPAAVTAAPRRPELYAWLTLVDALRLGGPRERGVAAELVRHRLFGPDGERS